ncbi:hypothetical protein [Corallibacter sp.]|uniref:hypothetical protein n=1 Tax=Corallibacter sp. TaxID=2038084 RepID=UPI003AB1F035
MEHKEENKINSNPKSEKDLLKYIPIIYPILVFFGFLNYDFYYRRFNIEIFKYLTINEFLFSFISLMYPLILYVIIFILHQLIIQLFTNDKKDKEFKPENAKETYFWSNKNRNRIIDIFFHNFKTDKYKTKKSIYQAYWNLFWVGLSKLIIFLLKAFLMLWIIYLFISFISKDERGVFENASTFIVITVLWLLFFVGYYQYKSRILGLKYGRKSKILFLSVIFILSVKAYQNIKYENFLDGINQDSISFDYNDGQVQTNKDLKLIGITSNFIFLYDSYENTNNIYKMDDIKNLKVKNNFSMSDADFDRKIIELEERSKRLDSIHLIKQKDFDRKIDSIKGINKKYIDSIEDVLYKADRLISLYEGDSINDYGKIIK